MMNLVKAHQELFRRAPDECFRTLGELLAHCQGEKEVSRTGWYPPAEVRPCSVEGQLGLAAASDRVRLNDWSFSQLCRLADIQKDTINRLSAETAARVLGETLPQSEKPFQIFTKDETVRSVHGVSYTRLYNVDVLALLSEWAVGFCPPQEAANGGAGLYCGEQDMFCFLIDPTGWVEVGEHAFAPGFFVWNSEVGRRTVGIQSFWFQAVCQNHIVWDVTDISEFSHKHTANVADALEQIRLTVANLAERRDRRRDGFADVIRKALSVRLGRSVEQALPVLLEQGISRGLAQEALSMAKAQGALTVFTVIDALTRLSQRLAFAGGRAEVDAKAAKLLALTA